MIVYVAQRGCYENRHVAGIYDSAERAMADQPGHWTRTVWPNYPNWPSLVPVGHWESWDNDLDWDDACSITSMEVVDEGPCRQADEIALQKLKEGDAHGNWEYVPITSSMADALRDA